MNTSTCWNGHVLQAQYSSIVVKWEASFIDCYKLFKSSTSLSLSNFATFCQQPFTKKPHEFIKVALNTSQHVNQCTDCQVMSKVDLKSGVKCQRISVDLLVSSGWVRPRSTQWSTFALEVRKCSCRQQSNCLCCIKCGVHVFTSVRATMCWVGGWWWPGLAGVAGLAWSLAMTPWCLQWQKKHGFIGGLIAWILWWYIGGVVVVAALWFGLFQIQVFPPTSPHT